MPAVPPVDDAGLAVPAFVTGRAGGVSQGPYAGWNLAEHVGDDSSAVAENRALLERVAGVPVAYMDPEHGAVVARVTAPGVQTRGDALVTDVNGLALAALAADCVPVLLVATGVSGPVAVGAAHVGRRGLAAGVVPATVAALRELAPSARLSASIGPGVCGLCYEVPAAMRDEVADVVPEAWSTTRQGTPALDIPAGVAAQLQRLAVAVARTDGRCTVEDAGLFSHRRDGVTGRFAAVIQLP